MSFGKAKEVEWLNREMYDDFVEYRKTAEEYNQALQEPIGKLNAQLALINAERNFMRYEMKELYEFLKKFGDVGEEVTPFDFEVEPLRSTAPAKVLSPSPEITAFAISNKLPLTVGAVAGASLAATPVVGAAAAVSAVAPAALGVVALPFAPLAVPLAGVPFIVEKFIERGKNKKKLLQGQVEFENQRAKYINDFEKRDSYCKYIVEAANIAHLYHSSIAFIKDTIKAKIVPELRAVLCFFFADAMIDGIQNKNEIPKVNPLSPKEYRGTIYDKHYLFVKNSADLYVFITRVFTETVLTKILDPKCDEDSRLNAQAELELKYKEIEQKVNETLSCKLLMGEHRL